MSKVFWIMFKFSVCWILQFIKQVISSSQLDKKQAVTLFHFYWQSQIRTFGEKLIEIVFKFEVKCSSWHILQIVCGKVCTSANNFLFVFNLQSSKAKLKARRTEWQPSETFFTTFLYILGPSPISWSKVHTRAFTFKTLLRCWPHAPMHHGK